MSAVCVEEGGLEGRKGGGEGDERIGANLGVGVRMVQFEAR